MASQTIKVLGAGSAILDLLARVDDSFIDTRAGGGKGGMVLVDAGCIDTLVSAAESPVKRVIGGSAGNTIFALARLGMTTSLLGKVGADSEGEFYRQAFTSLGGDAAPLKVHPGMRTGRCLSLITPDSERTMRTDLAAAATLEPEEITAADFQGITHLHIEGYMLFNMKAALRILQLAKECGCTVSLDLASFEVVRIFRNSIHTILKDYVDLVFANEDEAREFCDTTSFSPESALDMLSGYCSTAVVKLGKKGAVIRRNGQNTAVEAELVQAVDTTGAGDLWQAGFLYGYLRGLPMETCGRMAAVTGAEVVQIIGASIPDNRWPVIRSRFAQLESK